MVRPPRLSAGRLNRCDRLYRYADGCLNYCLLAVSKTLDPSPKGLGVPQQLIRLRRGTITAARLVMACHEAATLVEIVGPELTSLPSQGADVRQVLGFNLVPVAHDDMGER